MNNYTCQSCLKQLLLSKQLCLLFPLLAAATLLYAQTPVVNAKGRAAAITINGNPTETDWEFTNSVTKRIVGTTTSNTVTYAVLWDSLNLYVAIKVTDANLFNESANNWDDDAVEIYIDAENNGGTSYGANDRQFIKEWNSTTLWEKTNRTAGVQHGWATITGGYAIEMAIPWSNIGITNPAAGLRIGFDVANDDDDNGGVRETQLMWAGDGNNWQFTQAFGDLLLTGGDVIAPSAPTNLAASAFTQSSLTLNWTASTDNVGLSGYDVYRNGVKINASLISTTTYNVTGLNAATAYQFYIQAKDAAGNTSANSNPLNVTIPDSQPPTTPSNLFASTITQTSATVIWTASTDNVGITGYDIYQDGVKINAANVTTTNYAVTGLTAATTYSFVVRSKDAAGNTTASSPLNSTTLPPADTQAPARPLNLITSGSVQTSVSLSWTAATDNVGVTGYDVYRNGAKINATPISATTYTVINLAALTQYNFYVLAMDAAGNTSVSSDTVSITTPDTQAPTAPTNLVVGNVTDTSLLLSWNASTDNASIAGYDVYRNSIKMNAALVNGTSLSVTGLSQATTYNFLVRAVDSAGNVSANSNVVNVTTRDVQAPTSPAALTSSNITATTLSLSWTTSGDNVGVTGYNVYRNGTKINSTLVSTTSYNVSGLTPITSYNFYVQARDAAGNISANSNTLNVTTPAAAGCSGTGAINFGKWNNVTGAAVSNLTSLATYPGSPGVSGTLPSFEIPSNGGDNYGIRVYGYICPPTTGSYTFWIAGDDNCELWLSTTNSAANRQRIAYHTSYTGVREWNKFTTQKSVAINLTAGQLYFVEAMLKEASQGDNMAVGWAKPGQGTTVPSEVIPGVQLVAQVPDIQSPSAPTNLRTAEVTQTTIALNWMAASDNIGLAGYDIYNGANVKLNGAAVTALNYIITGLTPSTTYNFYVKAKDAAGNVSTNSNSVFATTVIPQPGIETFTQRTVIAAQRMPHDLVYGPDNNLWYTERFAGTVSFVVPATGVKRVVLSLGGNMARTGGQDGLMGLALHPQFKQGKPWVYISYTYLSTSSTVRRTRIARYTYDSIARNLVSPVTVLENIPGSSDHNSARIAIGPDLRLYYSVGDLGAGQFENLNRTQNAQAEAVLEGKILRLNTEPVGGSWIPADNPFTAAGTPTAVYSLGHRNPQGLVWGNVSGTPILYSSEHGPYSDDELNIIERGRNYGWPAVAGFCDGNYNNRFIGGFRVVSEQANCASLNAKEPLRSLFPSATPPDSTTSNLTWPSTAPSGMDFYSGTAIPGWQNSLLVAQLKSGTISRFKLSSDGQSIISDTINYFRGKGRFRDVVVSADGLKIYVACDSSGSTSGPTGGVTSSPANPGSILEFTYQPPGGVARIRDLYVQASVEEIKDKTIDIYPNPASAYFVVFNHTSATGGSVLLTDVNGRILKKALLTASAIRIETSDLANGLYIVNITDSKGKTIRTEKIIIQK